ncbi:MAG: hypothetical protein U0031_10265 [Thermomicrobiales bacterium]
MDGRTFDRIVATLSGSGPRRDAVKVALAAGLSVAASRFRTPDTQAGKKKRCRKIGESCGGKHKCCNNSRSVKCQEFPVGECQDLSGFHCCGIEGARCDPHFGTPSGGGPNTFGNCSCCGPLFCGKQLNGEFRCQTEDT